MATKPSTHPDDDRAARRYPSLEKPAGPPAVEILDSDPPEVKRSKKRHPSLYQKSKRPK